MKLSPILFKSLNNHITAERFANSAYKSMEIAFDAVAWKGFAKWAHEQAEDELKHAQMFIEYIDERNLKAELQLVEKAPVFDGTNILDCFSSALKLEQTVTELIERLFKQAQQENDEGACDFLRWFINEQTDSEKELIDLINEIGRSDNTGLLIIDKRYR